MKNIRLDDSRVSAALIGEIPGGLCVTRTSDFSVVYANDYLIGLMECEDFDDLMGYTGGCFDGMVDTEQVEVLHKDFAINKEELSHQSGYAFYNMRTKSGKLHRVVNHWSLVTDPEEGELIYAMIFLHKLENTSYDYDPVTALFTRSRFKKHLQETAFDSEDGASVDYALVYINLVNFKLINIDRGVAEGDTCLKFMAKTLIKVYGHGVVSRLGDDHFAVFTKYEGVAERTEEAGRLFAEEYGAKYNVIGKFGIYKVPPMAEFDVEAALSQAKAACDYIKYDVRTDIIEFTADLEKRIKTAEYVTAHIDEALKEGWIKVYLQPVIRSLTGWLCGMESLVRWDDPKIGFLPPDQFIETLERERSIHKLDSFVVENVCRYIHERMSRRLPIVPVSVNFSRLDFIMCDMLEVVEKAVEKYDIPRDYIHIEITESMIASDEELMKEIVESFRKAGYEIWMDDFGSGYSSLTVLKEFRFDTLKLDMRFLYPLTDKSKNIVSSTINMAKEIGMKTVAEGVETKEQLEFLKDAGCEMIQGYYYGRPEPEDAVFRTLSDKGINAETRKWRHFYEVASANVRVTDEPLEVIEDTGDGFRTLFMNRIYREQILDGEHSLEDIDALVYNPAYPLMTQYRKFADQIERSKKPETFYYTAKGNYYKFTGQALAKNGSHYIIKGSIVNITHDNDLSMKDRLDSRLRELNLLFESVLFVDLNDGTLMPLLGGFQYIAFEKGQDVDIAEAILKIVNEHIFPSDRRRCLEFLNVSNVAERLSCCGKGYLEELVRIRQADGNYQWKEMYIMHLAGVGGNAYLFCLKPRIDMMSESVTKDPDRDPDAGFADLFRSLMWNSNVRFFWKDKDRRFRGASRAYLDYFGLGSMEEIMGRTVEEMGWVSVEDPYAGLEEEVVSKGRKLFNTPGKCIARGQVRQVMYHKMPLYQNDRIVGLIGYIEDVEEKLAGIEQIKEADSTDPVTGLMNSHAFVDAMIEYVVNYNSRGRDYGIIVLNNTTHGRILDSYGEDFGDAVLRRIGEGLLEAADGRYPVGRTKDSVFVVLAEITDKQDFRDLADRIKEKLGEITEVDGNGVTIRAKVSAKIRSEEGTSDEGLYELALKEVTEE